MPTISRKKMRQIMRKKVCYDRGVGAVWAGWAFADQVFGVLKVPIQNHKLSVVDFLFSQPYLD